MNSLFLYQNYCTKANDSKPLCSSWKEVKPISPLLSFPLQRLPIEAHPVLRGPCPQDEIRRSHLLQTVGCSKEYFLSKGQYKILFLLSLAIFDWIPRTDPRGPPFLAQWVRSVLTQGGLLPVLAQYNRTKIKVGLSLDEDFLILAGRSLGP
jgi:hypothetical protein